MASRVFSRAHTPPSPAACSFQTDTSGPFLGSLLTMASGVFQRSGDGNPFVNSPKKLSSRVVMTPTWASLPPIRPAWYGLAPSFASSSSPSLSAERT